MTEGPASGASSAWPKPSSATSRERRGRRLGCLTVGGETVVDLWGGVGRPEDRHAVDRDTVGIVFSCTKGATALCAHVLASRGQLDIDAPVAEFWPEFGQQRQGARRPRA